MPCLKSVACRISARPSPHLTYPTQGINKAQLDVLGITAPDSNPPPSTTSICHHTVAHDEAAGESGRAAVTEAAAGGNVGGAAVAGAGAGVPAGVAVGTQARERKGAAGPVLGEADAAMAHAWEKSDKLEVTADTGLSVSAVLEPGTPNDVSDPEDIDHMEEV